MGERLFITGTGTDVGKTVLTALLLAHYRSEGKNCLALKPFCAGGRADALLLEELMEGQAGLEEINPWYSEIPAAPRVALMREGRQSMDLGPIKNRIQEFTQGSEILLVEGIGGLCVPLDAHTLFVDLMVSVGGEAILVGSNTLGTLNHSLLSLRELERQSISVRALILMDEKVPDETGETNALILKQKYPEIPLFCLPFLGPRVTRGEDFRAHAKKLKKTLVQI